MVFSSTIFIFWFLPAFLAVYYLTPLRWRSTTITIGSYIFYGWWRVDFVPLLAAVTVWAWISARMIHREPNEKLRKFWLLVGVSVALLTLAYFKYANFLADSLNGLLALTGRKPFAYDHILLPIGISFFTFQAISYIVDVYRRDAEPATLVDLAAFKALFPQLVAGPVLRYKDLADQFAERTHTLAKFGEGVVRFAQGLAMKVLIADTIAPLVDYCFTQDQPSFADAWLGAIAYTAQLYFDFAGYSSMAIGLGLMIGFRFIENFNQPYASLSITEFWRRWHISLSTWLRDYLYIPLGGNRGGELLTSRNLWLTMVLGGLWHGANWTFILWGVWHGSIMAVERRLGYPRQSLKPGLSRHWAQTFLFVMIGWVMFRSPTVGNALAMYRGMIGANGLPLSDVVAWQIKTIQLCALAIAYAIIAKGALDVWKINTGRWMVPQRSARAVPALASAGWLAILTLSVAKLSADSFSPFLYFQF